MNILIGKIGRAISFNPEKWSGVGGDNEAPTLILKMAQMYPNDTFYICQSTDFAKTQYAQRFTNIVPLMQGFNVTYDTHRYLTDKINRMGIKMDYCIMYNGITSMTNIAGVLYKNKKGEMTHTKTLVFSDRYCANIVTMLNELPDLKWMLLTPDPRYFPLQAVDIKNPPEYVLSQYTAQSRWKFREYLTREEHFTPLEMVYAGIENVFLINKKRPPMEPYINSQRTETFNLVLNQGKSSSGGLDRYPILKEWVLDSFPTEYTDKISIYGKWEEEVMKDERFKGPVRIEKLKNLLFNTRYTFVIPIDKDWATAKFAEMCYYGIIPFMHPYYDTQRNIACPDFLRVQTPDELVRKIQFLESHPEARKKLLTQLYELYNDDIYSGKTIVQDEIYSRILTSKNNI